MSKVGMRDLFNLDRERRAELLAYRIRDYANVVRAHDHVHPDRNQCSDAGPCSLLGLEHDAREAVTDRLIELAREGYRVSVTVHADEGNADE